MKVSIITATYNSQDKISLCLESVAKQSALASIEHIVVDGGSTDNTLSIVNTYPHLRQVLSEADNGIYDAFNKGLKMASGDIIYYLNSDDLLYTDDVISKVVAMFQQQDIDFVSARVMMCDEGSKAEWLQNPRKVVIQDKSFDYPSHQGFFIRTALLRKYGGFPRCFNIVADSYVMLKAMATAKGCFSELPVAKFLIGGVSSTAVNLKQVDIELDAIYRLLGVTKANSVDDELSLTKANLVRLRALFSSSLQRGRRCLVEEAGSVGIFGTGVMSALIHDLLKNKGVCVQAFFTSQGAISLFHNLEVKPLAQLIEVDTLINCIEGPHATDITQRCLETNPQLRIFQWHEIYG